MGRRAFCGLDGVIRWVFSGDVSGEARREISSHSQIELAKSEARDSREPRAEP
jgi:hypothetical protein